MKNLARTLAVLTAIATTPLLMGFFSSADARGTSLTKLQNEGFRACRAQGRSGYTAVVKGKRDPAYYGVRGGTDNFSLRYCFPSRSQCERFISRAMIEIRDVQEIRYRSCEPR